MEITWLGHGCFRIRAKEATVVTDPVDKTSGYSLGRPTADLVTVSCDDPAHNAVGAIAGDPRVINGPGEFEIAGASVVGVTTWRGKDKTAGRNVSYVIELEDVRIGHLGGIGHVPTSDQVEEMGAIDILLVPVGGGDALDGPPAAETVNLLEPRLVIPMHFQTDTDKYKLDPVDRFLKEMGMKPGEHHAKIAVTRSTLPEETQVLVLDYKR
ncbi:MAG: MBL fold metallo-hydrolase [Chloroflexi bacterium]|nr:MBL fold metallo-hydrolase [Chloroflexota bacterium]